MAIRELLRRAAVGMALLGTSALLANAQQPSPPIPPDAGWVRDGRPTFQAVGVVNALVTADQRGLRPSDYRAVALADQIGRITRDAAAGRPWPADSLAKFDSALTGQLNRFASDLHIGRVNPRQVKFDLVVDGKHLDATEVVTRLRQTNNVSASIDSLEPPYVHYRALKAALAQYRAMPASTEQAKQVRQIELTLERWRWLPTDLGARFILVNVSAFQLYAYDLAVSRDTPQVSMSVVVGKAARTPTPIFTGKLQYLIFRPYWNIPSGILRNETLPRLRRDPGYLQRERLELVDANAPEGPAKTYPATSANLARLASGSLRVRQKPGGKNALGLVKFMFPNRYDVYLHDTPAQTLFAESRRDFSHGCIRVAQPPSLAQFILHDRPEWTLPAIDSAMRSGSDSRRINIEDPLNVYVLYGTVLADPNGTVHFYSDVYKLDAALEAALAKRSIK